MTTLTYLTEEELVSKAIRVLMDTLGPIETSRFLSLPQAQVIDSVERHRQWQDNLDEQAFLTLVFGAETTQNE